MQLPDIYFPNGTTDGPEQYAAQQFPAIPE